MYLILYTKPAQVIYTQHSSWRWTSCNSLSPVYMAGQYVFENCLFWGSRVQLFKGIPVWIGNFILTQNKTYLCPKPWNVFVKLLYCTGLVLFLGPHNVLLLFTCFRALALVASVWDTKLSYGCVFQNCCYSTFLVIAWHGLLHMWPFH